MYQLRSCQFFVVNIVNKDMYIWLIFALCYTDISFDGEIWRSFKDLPTNDELQKSINESFVLQKHRWRQNITSEQLI